MLGRSHESPDTVRWRCLPGYVHPSEGAVFAALDRLSGHNFGHKEIVERKVIAAQAMLTASNN
jgi:hypothetical protein